MPINQTTLSVEIIKQYPGEQTAARRVKANITGKFFPQGNSNPQSKKALYEFWVEWWYEKQLKRWPDGVAGGGNGGGDGCGTYGMYMERGAENQRWRGQ